MLKQIALAALLCFCVYAHAQAATPERKVVGHTLISERDPKVRIEVPNSSRYVGADRWILYDMADCELHVFVDVSAQNNVQRLYWIQFEGYVPSKPNLAHSYDSPQHTSLGGMDFYVDTWVRPTDAKTTPGSDWEHVQTMIRSKGYNLPAGMMTVRLVHLLDATKRKELMIIYSEDVASTGFTAEELSERGEDHAHWASINQELANRAKSKVSVSQ